MFKDYYDILEIQQSASPGEIKAAYRRLSLKWHPDKNHNRDTTSIFQEINEAYIILKDEEARKRYDSEYLRFKAYSRNKKEQKKKEKTTDYSYTQNNSSQESSTHQEKSHSTHSEYQFNDDILKKWMENAKKQAVEYTKQTVKDIGKLSVSASKAAGVSMGTHIIGYIVGGLILSILFRACM